jgi:hypothetical protein
MSVPFAGGGACGWADALAPARSKVRRTIKLEGTLRCAIAFSLPSRDSAAPRAAAAASRASTTAARR